MGYKDDYLGADMPRGGDALDYAAFPQNQFGPFEHTMFLGCSVMSFSATVGWNEQVSELTVQLVRDEHSIPDNADPKVYYDKDLLRRTTRDPDPGFFFAVDGEPPAVGSAVYFRVADFEFAGLLQNWSENSSASGTTYTVKITDPRQILANAQLLIGAYSGGLPRNLHNVFNVYGFMERFGGHLCYSLDVDGVSFGSRAGAYGGSDINTNGMPIARILLGAQLLTSALPAGILTNYTDIYGYPFSPWGRLIYKGPTTLTSSYGVMSTEIAGLSYFMLDISEVPFPPFYVRQQGTSISILDLISRLADDMGFDYYVELLPTRSSAAGSIAKFIKVRTVSRARQPQFGVIDDFVGDCNDEGTFLAVNRNKGRELRNEQSSSMIIGGNQHSIYQSYNWYPYWGDNPDGTVIPTPDADGEGFIYFYAPTFGLSLQTAVVGSTILIHEKEMLFALAGFDSWVAWATTAQTESILPFGTFQGMLDFTHLVNNLDNVLAGRIAARDFHAMRPTAYVSPFNAKTEDLQRMYQFVLSFARDFYGKQFLFDIPFTCYYYDSDNPPSFSSSVRPHYTDIPSDGGWGWMNSIIGLSHPTKTAPFTLPDNRLGAFIGYDYANQIDFEHLGGNKYVLEEANNALYVQASVNRDLKFAAGSPTPKVLLTIPQAVTNVNDLLSDGNMYSAIRGVAVLANEMTGNDQTAKVGQAMLDPGGLSLMIGVEHQPRGPIAAAVPLQNTTRVYGPWVGTKYGSRIAKPLPAGMVSIKRDEGLVPWEYGSGWLMHTAAAYLANADVSYMQTGETGQVTFAGYPDVPLGAELGARKKLRSILTLRRRGVHSHDKFEENENEQGVKSYSYVSSAIHMPAGLSLGKGIFGPNITDINVDVGPNGIQTTYTLRTFTPKHGRFAKYNAERLKTLGQTALRNRKELWLLSSQVRSSELQRALQNAQDHRPLLGHGVAFGGGTSSEVWVGKIIEHPSEDGKYRTIVSATSLKDGIHELGNAEGKAIASLDMLIRPVAIGGAHDILPQYAEPKSISDAPLGHPRAAVPPVQKGTDGEGDTLYELEIDQKKYNPLSNPTSLDSDSVASYTDTPTVGHDIDILSREDYTESLVMPIQGMIDSASSDYKATYRTFALRGPLLLQSWGYDLDGKPIPNKADTVGDIQNGDFESASLQDKFLDDFLQNSTTWPVAPVDLRFDRSRGVWTCPPAYRLVPVELQGSLDAHGTQTASVLDTLPIYDAEGTTVSEYTVEITEILGNTLPSGTSFVAYYDTHTDVYWPLGSDTIPTSLNSTTIPGDLSSIDKSHRLSSINMINFDSSTFEVSEEWSGESEGEGDLTIHIASTGTGIAGATGIPNHTGVFGIKVEEISGVDEGADTLGFSCKKEDAVASIAVVGDIYCEGAEIVTETTYIHIDNCGRIVGNSNAPV